MKINESDLQQLLTAMEGKNLSITEVVALINGQTDNNKLPLSNYDIKLTVDYTKTLEQAIADGRYDWKNSDINAKDFPFSPEMVGKKADIIGKLFHFDYDISSEDAIKKMDEDGYRPATLMELLTLGVTHPELQRQFPIIALGSFWRRSLGNRRVAFLDDSVVGRGLGLDYVDWDWLAHFRFFGVRK